MDLSLEKECIACHKTLVATAFYKAVNGLSSRCKRCTKEQKAARAREDRQRYFEYLSKQCCADCGISDPIVLTHDHKDPSNKFKKVSAMVRHYSWAKVEQEIAKCDVVCANCHARRTAKTQKWYQDLIP